MDAVHLVKMLFCMPETSFLVWDANRKWNVYFSNQNTLENTYINEVSLSGQLSMTCVMLLWLTTTILTTKLIAYHKMEY